VKFYLISLATILLLGAVSCTKKSAIHSKLDRKETLRLNMVTEPPTLDWHKATDTSSSLITVNIMEGLTTYDEAFKGQEVAGQ
jgi:ABC-type oligopeptide transport system substrate-binding subunit